MAVLPKRFGKYGLTIHPEKTRLVEFRPHRPKPPSEGSGGKSFDLLGFTHYWGRSRRGAWVVKRKTASNRLSRALKQVTQWCRLNRHRPLAEQHRVLSQKLQGHYGYFGITGNSKALVAFAWEVRKRWHKWLSRRTHQARTTWEQFDQIIRRFPLPKPRAVHSLFRLAANP
jgi:RNA-directed DNA polymerase